MHQTQLGILFMILAQAIYVIVDGSVKLLEINYPTGQLLFLRNLFGILPFFVFITIRNKAFKLNIPKLIDHFPNSIAILISTYLVLFALSKGALNEIVAVSFSVVFFVCILSNFLLKERICLHRWVATIVGFLGVLIMINPSTLSLNSTTLWALIACPFDAYSMIRGKQLSLHYSTAEILFFNLLFGTLITSVNITLPTWITPTPHDLLLLGMIGIGSISAYGLVIKAYTKACTSVVGPMIYSSMLWSLVFTYIVWQEIPSLQLLLGAFIIILSGIYIIRIRYKMDKAHQKELLKELTS
ncbi:MAG: EamA-like family transporter [Francisellaceae bacterium]|nr:EamA-like family transporter [Francisellaceae bacterium]